jgi:hypothetical protein
MKFLAIVGSFAAAIIASPALDLMFLPEHIVDSMSERGLSNLRLLEGLVEGGFIDASLIVLWRYLGLISYSPCLFSTVI